MLVAVPARCVRAAPVCRVAPADAPSFLSQDAIKCDWPEFIKSMPHLETKIQDDNSYAHGQLVFRMKPLVPVYDRKMFIKSFTVNNRQDLWRVCHKAPSAVMEFPDMEFEIGADGKRKIDSLWNERTIFAHYCSFAKKTNLVY